MALTPQQLLDKLSAAGVLFEKHEHPPVMTAEAQIKELAGVEGVVTKNLFLKDKKHRCYIVTALPDTKIDLKSLSARLGVGKGAVSMASEELLQAVLQVPLGSVSALAVANPSASDVVLLLDQRIRGVAAVFAHPLVNTVSLALAPAQLEAALRALGREAVYVDLELDPKIDRDHPPDLRQYAEAAQPPPAALPAGAGPSPAEHSTPGGTAMAGAASQTAPTAAAATATGAAPAAATAAAGGPGKSAAAKGKGKANGEVPAAAAAAGGGSGRQLQRQADVNALTEAILEQVSASLGASLAGQEPYLQARLRADLAMQLNALRNAAYTAGYVAGKGEVVAHARKQYA